MTAKPSPIRIVLGSSNAHKMREYREIMGQTAVELLEPSAVGIEFDVTENGTTFLENARIKALALSQLIDDWAMGDDSGLSVDCLDGEPGVHSRRFGHIDSDAGRIEHLLNKMTSFSNHCRKARFLCAVVLAKHGNVVFETQRSCEGSIFPHARGHHGFGYDPVFIPEGHSATLGQLGPEVKNQISHRSFAAKDLVDFIRTLHTGLT